MIAQIPSAARSKKKRSSPQRLIRLVATVIVLPALCCSCLLLVVKQGKEDNSFISSFDSILAASTTSTLAAPAINAKYRHVSCPDAIANSKHEDFYDPNKGLKESPKRHTITTPPFWISMHTEQFDKMRWVCIMNKGYYYEMGLTKIFKDILTSTTSPGLVLDVGMNIGWFTLWARKHGHSVAAFEPNPVMHVRVCKSLALNGWDKDESVKIYPYGVANEERVMNLTIGRNPGGSSFHEDRLAKKYRASMPVNVVKIDSVAKQEGWLDVNAPPIHLMKIDIEGYENFAVKGGIALIQSRKAANIIVENSITEEVQGVAFLGDIYQSGYQVHSLLSVNGDPLSRVQIADVNKEISLIPSRDSSFVYDQSRSPAIYYLLSHTLNMWWVKRDE